MASDMLPFGFESTVQSVEKQRIDSLMHICPKARLSLTSSFSTLMMDRHQRTVPKRGGTNTGRPGRNNCTKRREMFASTGVAGDFPLLLESLSMIFLVMVLSVFLRFDLRSSTFQTFSFCPDDPLSVSGNYCYS
ncbi:hypothetical protein M9H77_19832 [Catharanthus roseus]|uniref:Uncharacterized protein n=1 Tax=Catharanthus roseus TaxID=4058 RepID=A0ACC0BBD2_CATRO|nr:hypothetical protein M9H77_19832 [Catharanthus roseus]